MSAKPLPLAGAAEEIHNARWTAAVAILLAAAEDEFGGDVARVTTEAANGQARKDPA